MVGEHSITMVPKQGEHPVQPGVAAALTLACAAVVLVALGAAYLLARRRQKLSRVLIASSSKSPDRASEDSVRCLAL